jgi:hypothetical protein
VLFFFAAHPGTAVGGAATGQANEANDGAGDGVGFPRPRLVAVGVRVDVIAPRTDGGMLRSGGCLPRSREGGGEEEGGVGGLWSVGACWILVQTDIVTALSAGRRPKTRAKGLYTGSQVHSTRSRPEQLRPIKVL